MPMNLMVSSQGLPAQHKLHIYKNANTEHKCTLLIMLIILECESESHIPIRSNLIKSQISNMCTHLHSTSYVCVQISNKYYQMLLNTYACVYIYIYIINIIVKIYE